VARTGRKWFVMPVEEQPVSKEMVGRRRFLIRRSPVFK
jgi:hypothetical protein